MDGKIHVVCPSCDTTNRVARERRGAGARCGTCKEALFPGKTIELRKASFDRHIASNDLPVVVDFWAPWCGPCRMMAPAYEQAADRLASDVRIAKLNTDVNTLLRQPEVRELIAKQGMTAAGGSSERFGDLVKKELARWSRVVAAAGIKAD